MQHAFNKKAISALRLSRPYEAGTTLFLVLIAVALFAALSYVVTRSSRGGGTGIVKEKAQIDAAMADQCIAYIDHGFNRLRLSGCPENQISYELANGANANPLAPPNHSCHMFHPDGLGMAPCGAYAGGTAPLTISGTAAIPDIDLTAEGVLDWIFPANDARKDGAATIQLAPSGTWEWGGWTGSGVVHWSDGTPWPETEPEGLRNSWWNDCCGTASYFSVTVPATANVRTLRLYLLVGWGNMIVGTQTATITAQYANSNDPEFEEVVTCDASIPNTDGFTCAYVYTVAFSNATPQDLTVTWRASNANGVGIRAATLH